MHRSNAPLVVVNGFFDFLNPGGQAEAKHILIKGPGADTKCESIKNEIYKTALGTADPANGVNSEKLISAFQQAARKNSACPSAKQGGDLGSFGKGQMVPEFDAVVFSDPVGVVHGPVKTQFGSHLILITDRD